MMVSKFTKCLKSRLGAWGKYSIARLRTPMVESTTIENCLTLTVTNQTLNFIRIPLVLSLKTSHSCARWSLHVRQMAGYCRRTYSNNL